MNKQSSQKTLFIVQAAIIAAIYIVVLLAFKPLGSDAIQVRFSEALTVLPYFTPAAIPGVSIGCLLGGILSGLNPIDFVFGSLTTLIAATLSYSLRKNKYLVVLPPIILNALVVPFIIKYCYAESLFIPFGMLTVGIGQVLSCGVLGLLLLFALDKYKTILFK